MLTVFLHGLETGPFGAKYQILKTALPDLVAPDCEGVFDIRKRLEIIEYELQDRGPLLLVGSSFGGLAAALYCSRHRSRIRGAVLCAPAIHIPAGDEVQWLPAETVIIQGRQDVIVPPKAVVAFAERFPSVRLLLVDDDHRLKASQGLLVEEVVAMRRRLGA